jgi:hypothetical protein
VCARMVALWKMLRSAPCSVVNLHSHRGGRLGLLRLRSGPPEPAGAVQPSGPITVSFARQPASALRGARPAPFEREPFPLTTLPACRDSPFIENRWGAVKLFYSEEDVLYCCEFTRRIARCRPFLSNSQRKAAMKNQLRKYLLGFRRKSKNLYQRALSETREGMRIG